MHTKRTIWIILTAVVTLLMLAALTIPALARESRPPTNPQDRIAFQEADPADRVRAELEGKGYNVREVGLSNDNALAGVFMDMVSFEFNQAVRQQIVDGWAALNKAYTDPSITAYLSGLVYQEDQYILCFFVAPADFRDWIGGNLSDQAFAAKYVLKIMDTKTGQWVTDKDFLHKNFGVPAGTEGAEAVGPLPKPVEGSSKAAFEDDFSDPKSGWDEKTADTYSYGYKDGEYFCREEQANYMVRGTYPKLQFDDFTYQADCRQAEGDPENEYGLVFRQTDKDYYKFGVTAAGYYQLSLRKNDEWVKVVDWTESTAIKRGDQVNVLKVVCAGKDISLYVNDTHLQTVQDSGLSKGYIGLFAGGWEKMPTEARFDNVKVWTGAPGPQPTPSPTPTVKPTGGVGPITLPTPSTGPVTTPSVGPAPTPTVQATGASFGSITFCSKVEKGTNKALDPGTSFAAGTLELHAVFDYSGLSSSNQWTRKWYLNDKVAIDKTEAWSGSDSGRWDYYLAMNDGKALPSGKYKLEIYIDGKLQQTASCTIGS